MAWSIASNLSRQRWARETIIEAEEKSFFFSRGFVKDASDAIIKKRTDLNKESGDRITYDFLVNLTGAGLTAADTKSTGLAAYHTATGLATDSSYGADAMGQVSDYQSGSGANWGDKTPFQVDDGTGTSRKGYGKLIGREEPLLYRSDQILIGQKRNGIRKPGKWLDQIVQDKFRSDARSQLSTWYAELVDNIIMQHLAGNSSTMAFPSAALAPTTSTTFEFTRQLFGGQASAKAGIEIGDSFGILELDRMRELAEVSVPRILPYKVEGGDEYHVVILHPYQANALRQDRDWIDASYHARDRGLSNPLFTGAMGLWNGLVIHVSRYVPILTDGGASGAVPYARALLLGQCAGGYATGWEPTWHEDSTSSEADFGDSPALAIDCAFGCKKTQFAFDGSNQLDYGVITMDTWANKLQSAVQA